MNENKITVTMPIEEYNAMLQRQDFWQNSFNSLYRIVSNYADKNSEGFYTINDCDQSNLATELENFLNDYDF